MRSRAGVGMTPPKVPETPYPWSSVMMRSTLGAPLGGTTRGGHQGVESLALSLITPPNLGGGAGSCFPSIVVVASAEPNWPVTCWAVAAGTDRVTGNINAAIRLGMVCALITDFRTPSARHIRSLLT